MKLSLLLGLCLSSAIVSADVSPFQFSDSPMFNMTLSQLFYPDLINFTRTAAQVAPCYVDQLKDQNLNLFNCSLEVKQIVAHYYNAFPAKIVTQKSVETLLNSVKSIIKSCLEEGGAANQSASWGFTPLSDLDSADSPNLTSSPANSTHSRRSRRHTSDFDRPECSADDITHIPARFDWRDRGVVTKSKSQSGWTCWIFAAIGAIESAMLVHGKTAFSAATLDLSERQVEQCVQNGRSSGGFAEEAFEYVLKNGIAQEGDYSRAKLGRRRSGPRRPYDRWDYWNRNYENYERYYFDYYRGCVANLAKRVYPLKGYCVKTHRSEVGRRIITDRVMQQHLLKFGPLYVATSVNYHRENHGVVDDPGCTERGYLNHAVLLIGWTEQNWILKNSFGDDYGYFGDGSYRIARHNRNICGINTEIAFALL